MERLVRQLQHTWSYGRVNGHPRLVLHFFKVLVVMFALLADVPFELDYVLN